MTQTEKGKSLKEILQEFYQKNQFVRFDTFFVNYMLCREVRNPSIEQRKEAFHLFRDKTGKKNFASFSTMQKWFGLGGYTEPRRSHIFEFAFSLSLSTEGVNQFFQCGLCAPAIQVNDYQETIFWYGLENNYTYEKCLELIQYFERHMALDVEIVHTSQTGDLLHQFQLKKKLSEKQFMEWMVANAGAFKGYSQTTLNYLIKYKKVVLKQARQEQKDVLETTLSYTDYEVWKMKNRFRFKSESEGEKIRQYIYNNRKMPEEQRKEILNMVSFVYFEEDSNVRLISEIFGKKNLLGGHFSFHHIMTEKYLSDLLNVAVHKEREIRTAQAECVLKTMDEEPNTLCPQWIVTQMRECLGITCQDYITVKEALQSLSTYRKEHRRRLIQIERADLLPFVQYVVLQRYMESIQYQQEEYDFREARKQFVELADQTLSACNMARFSEEYELDALLLVSFQENECYLYGEMLEEMVKMKELSLK